MKKVLLPLFLLSLLLTTAVAFAGAGGDMAIVDVYVRQADGGSELVSSGRVTDTQVLVPAFIFPSHLAPGQSSFDQETGRLLLSVRKPAWQMETESLDKRLRQGVTLNFPAVLQEKEYFVNIKNLEKILGLRMRYDQYAGRLYLERDAAFSDRRLNTVRPAWRPQGKLNLVWDYIPGFSPDLSQQETIRGLDVISPTWFSIAPDGRLLINNADWKYVQDAHAKGYKVWPLFKNGDFDPDLTRKFLASETLQELVIGQMLVYTALYDLDGINIDFENVYEADRDRLTAFVKRVADALRQQNLVSSVDVTVPGPSPNWSKCYDRRGLSQAVDYVMVMTYDEHWGASPVAGPVASLNWVDENLALLADNHIPREKLVMGIPFYAREWRETTEPAGGVRVSSRAYGMEAIAAKVAERQLTPVWLEEQGLFYTEYRQAGSLYRIWLEEETSIARKAALVNKYNLAGAASWRKNFAAPHIWQVLETELKAPLQ
ncbi:MAG: glycosyl hydrolase family 18 protein [Sporomusaceae bacterium]|nr:glycosyl hydrolase family 18 protein [Sporomusaceae bacterium]